MYVFACRVFGIFFECFVCVARLNVVGGVCNLLWLVKRSRRAQEVKVPGHVLCEMSWYVDCGLAHIVENNQRINQVMVLQLVYRASGALSGMKILSEVSGLIF